MAGTNHFAAESFGRLHRLRAFAGGNLVERVGNVSGIERGDQLRCVKFCDRIIGDERRAAAGESGELDQVSDITDGALGDMNVVGAFGEIDMDGRHGRSMKHAWRMSIPDQFSGTTRARGGFSKSRPPPARSYLTRNQIAIARSSERIFAIQLLARFSFMGR